MNIDIIANIIQNCTDLQTLCILSQCSKDINAMSKRKISGIIQQYLCTKGVSYYLRLSVKHMNYMILTAILSYDQLSIKDKKRVIIETTILCIHNAKNKYLENMLRNFTCTIMNEMYHIISIVDYPIDKNVYKVLYNFLESHENENSNMKCTNILRYNQSKKQDSMKYYNNQ